jgi:hypothetical protein
MIIIEKDRFDIIGQNIHYLIDSIENGIVYYQTIGEYHTNQIEINAYFIIIF